MKQFKTTLRRACFLFTFIALAVNLYGQAEKKKLEIDDVMQWRSHSVALSNDGNWYTVSYSMTEKPDAEKKPKKDSTAVDSVNYEDYGAKLNTDILYIYNAEKGVKYEIPKGSSPKFSDNSEWIAYKIVKDANKKSKEKVLPTIELKNLNTGLTRQYESNAAYQFTKDWDYFITSDRQSLLIYDLESKQEHFIGGIGEYLIDRKTKLIAYTISSEDKRGNGIYLYDPEKRITKALTTGNLIYSGLSWNHDKTALGAIGHTKKDKKVDRNKMSVHVVNNIGSANCVSSDYLLENIIGVPDSIGFSVSHKIRFSKDNRRLFLKIRKYEPLEKKDPPEAKPKDSQPTVDVWHWKDEKLLSQRMKEAERTKVEFYDAVLSLSSKELIQLTSKELQRLSMSGENDLWAIAMDNRDYISDWDNRKYDLYRMNLLSGEKKLIEKKYPGSVNLSPDGNKAILWKDGHFWYYNLAEDTKHNISDKLRISFINMENDHWGSEPSYGFVGWVKGQDAIIVNHKLDLWMLPLDNKGEAKNLTADSGSPQETRFRIDDMSFMRKPDIEDRYIDLKSGLMLNAFNLKTKHAGYYFFDNKKMTKFIYEPVSFSGSRWGSGIIKAENSDVVIYKKGDYKNYPESYLSDSKFSKSKQITNTNPQQEKYKWGHRILIDYTNDDGEPLQGILSIPDSYKSGDKLPMVVYSYEKMSQNRYSYSSPRIGGSGICEMMYVSDDYLVLLPDIHFNVGTPHSDMHECIDAAIDKVIELGYVDERYIGYEGFSYGGHCGMYISTQENKFAAIAAGAGVSNLVQGFNIDIVGDGSNEQDYYMTGQGRLGTDPTGDTEMYISESAVFNASTMDTPLLLFHGTVDNVVQWEHSFGFYSILRYLKKPVVFLSYREEGHGLRQKGNRIDIQSRLKEYFDHYLKGNEASAWITDGLPYEPEEKKPDPKAKEKSKVTLPKWR